MTQLIFWFDTPEAGTRDVVFRHARKNQKNNHDNAVERIHDIHRVGNSGVCAGGHVVMGSCAPGSLRRDADDLSENSD